MGAEKKRSHVYKMMIGNNKTEKDKNICFENRKKLLDQFAKFSDKTLKMNSNRVDQSKEFERL